MCLGNYVGNCLNKDIILYLGTAWQSSENVRLKKIIFLNILVYHPFTGQLYKMSEFENNKV